MQMGGDDPHMLLEDEEDSQMLDELEEDIQVGLSNQKSAQKK